MATPKNKSELQRLAEDLERKQRNILWPELMRSGRAIDTALAKIGPKPLVQRIVGWIWGTCFVIGGITLLLAFELRLFSILLALPFIALGAHTFWVACKSGPARKL